MSHTRATWVIDVEARGLEDAEFILKCVNAHDELVAALQEIDALIPKPSLPLTHEIKRVVQKALAKAGAL